MIKTNTSKGVERSGVHRFVACDGCEESPLCGRRHRCTQCENYNLCTSCHDNHVHDHDTFEEISKSKSIVNIKRIGWGGLIDALKSAQQFQSEADNITSEHSEDMEKVCLLLDESPVDFLLIFFKVTFEFLTTSVLIRRCLFREHLHVRRIQFPLI